MKRKTILLCTCAVLWSILVIGLAWWYTPAAFLSDVAPEDITRIEVCNGTSGEKFTITDRDDITYIVTGIQDTKMRKQEFAKKDGFEFIPANEEKSIKLSLDHLSLSLTSML